MKENGHRALAVIGSDQSRFFNRQGRDAEEGNRERSGFRPVVPRWIFECAVATTEKDRQIVRLQIDDRDVRLVIAVKIPGKPIIRAGIGAGIVSRLKGRIAITQESGKTIPFTVDDE